MRNLQSNCKYALLITIGLLVLSLKSKPQDTLVLNRNFIGLTATELLFVDFRLSYERKINPTTGIKLEIGYKPDFTNFTDATKIDLGHQPTAWCYRNTAHWYYISVAYKYYFNRDKTLYLSSEFFYKTLNADHIVYTWGISEGGSSLTNQYETRSMSANMLGINLLVGKRFAFTHRNFAYGFDLYAGFSLRSKRVHTTIYGRTTATYGHDSPPRQVVIPSFDKPIETTDHFIQPSLQFGVVLFGGW